MFSGTRHGSVQCLGVIVENSRQGVLTVDGGVLAIFIAYGNSRLLLTASALMPRRLRPSKHILNKLTPAQYRQPLSGNGIESIFDAGQVSGDDRHGAPVDVVEAATPSLSGALSAL